MADPRLTTGGCLCGAVRYEVRGPLRDIIACHCEQCRRTSGHHVAATATNPDNLTLTQSDGLAWYQDGKMRRGFCRICGSSLFFAHGDERTAIAAGSLDDTSGLKIAGHIFVAEAGDYYELSDGLPRFDGPGLKLPLPED